MLTHTAETQPETPGRAALDASGMTLSYHHSPVVDQASLRLEAASVLSLVGPNGSGKSTLLRAMARLHRPDRGELSIDGEPGLAMPPRSFARLVTLLAQSRPTPSGVSVRHVVEYGRHPHRERWGRDPAGPTAVERAMELTGVVSMAGRSVDELSGGERQRVWIATCLAQDTRVLLLDEPTAHLDLRFQIEVLDLVRDLADDHGVAVGIVLHDLDQAAAVSDRVALLHGGRLLAQGRAEDVLTAERLTEVYGIPVAVGRDPITNQLTTRPLGRHNESERHQYA
jgi:ferric hydroxamate transport system ATP-binding protein